MDCSHHSDNLARRIFPIPSPGAEIVFDMHLEMAVHLRREIPVSALFAEESAESQQPCAKFIHDALCHSRLHPPTFFNIRKSFIAQSHDGIDAHCATSGDPTSQ